jgi:hypothetical protein
MIYLFCLFFNKQPGRILLIQLKQKFHTLSLTGKGLLLVSLVNGFVQFISRSIYPSLSSSFFTQCSNVETRLLEIPKIFKNASRKGFASASSFAVLSHSFEKETALSLISFQLRAICKVVDSG